MGSTDKLQKWADDFRYQMHYGPDYKEQFAKEQSYLDMVQAQKDRDEQRGRQTRIDKLNSWEAAQKWLQAGAVEGPDGTIVLPKTLPKELNLAPEEEQGLRGRGAGPPEAPPTSNVSSCSRARRAAADRGR